MYPWDEPKRTKVIVTRYAIVALLLIIGSTVMVVSTVQPSFRSYPATNRKLDPARLQNHVLMLTETLHPRNYQNVLNLDKTADYISDHFEQAGGAPTEQVYDIGGRQYRNVIACFGPQTQSRIVVGAHYDSFGEAPGADDNASGTAGLIELAYLLGQVHLNQQVELVAYTLEEPPFFRSSSMGSARHASALRKGGVDVEAMLCLEMIGCFCDVEGSQRYPSVMLRLLYPGKGNYIAIVGSMGDRRIVRHIKGVMRSATDLPVHAMCAPKGYPGLDFSDHFNYWKNGYHAVMVTDTAFMRNQRYHSKADTAETLDYERMAKVVLGVFEAVVSLAENED